MKKTVIMLIVLTMITGCAKRYDTATTIESKTTIKQDSAAPVSAEIPLVPMAGQVMKQNVGTGEIRQESAATTTRSLNGKKLIEVTFVKRNGSSSVLEVVETGERFVLKGDWGSAGDKFRIER